MERNQKQTVVEELNTAFRESAGVLLIDFSGINVADETELRRKMASEGNSYRVVKNTLAKRAVEGTEFECLKEALTGPLILAFSREDPGAAARIVKDFAKGNDKLVTRAVAIGGALYGPADLERLASLPTLDQARAILLGVLQAPAAKLVRTLAEPGALVARVLAARGKAEQAS